MSFLTRLRRPGIRHAGTAALTVAVAVFLAACGQYPDSIFHHRTDVNRDVNFLFKLILWLGTIVFIIVEAILVWTLIKFRQRPDQPEAKHVHGNTTLEITWTVLPLVVLIVIAIPTVSTIFKTQAAARSDALQVEVIGHQWWWEFRYPQYQIVTANELYLPLGRTVNFTLHSGDVIHSFWVPALNGKRDVVTNHTNYLWYTPDSATASAWNGACAEYCGSSHANMRFKTFTVSLADFESWAKHQQEPAVGTAAPPTVSPTGDGAAPAPQGAPTSAPQATTPPSPATTPVQLAGFIAFPRESLPAYTIPQTPLPAGLKFDESLLGKGDPANGKQIMQSTGGCLACHSIKGNPMMVGNIGPNLTHVASRTTIAAGLFPNDAQHLARWIKNAREMKAGVTMFTIGRGEYDPILKTTQQAGLTDQQIADVVAYLQTLK